LGLLEHASESLGVSPSAEAERAVHGGERHRTGRQQQQVERKLVAGGCPNDVAVGVDPGDDGLPKGDACRLGQPRERVGPDLAGGEGLGDEQRPVREVAFGRHELDVHELPRDRPKRQRGLERRHAAADDQDTIHGPSLRGGPRSAIGAGPDPAAGFTAARLGTCGRSSTGGR
jgi:hypothetical protein